MGFGRKYDSGGDITLKKNSKNSKKSKKTKKKYIQKKKIIVKKPTFNGYNDPDLPDNYEPPKTFKVLGYCPKCDMVLMENDFVSKMIFECPCGCRKHKKYLRLESKRELKRQKQKAISKKQYLREASSVDYNANTHVQKIPKI
jgi:hypothetical protein